MRASANGPGHWLAEERSAAGHDLSYQVHWLPQHGVFEIVSNQSGQRIKATGTLGRRILKAVAARLDEEDS